MLKSKQGGDWSSTGTFLRKPAGGWIHDEAEFQSGLSINYTVQYLGSVIVNTSMRTLQFNVRTQVTKEAIIRLAEQSGNVFLGKRRKTPKQVERLLGGSDVRWAGEVNLSISVESLKISDEVGGMVILNHSLPSISFASGGDGATTDYIGYVAKDPVHGRACHVFECPLSSHFVLATIGQAFELRYKIYLNGPGSSQPTRQNSDTWDERGASSRVRNDEGNTFQTLAEVHGSRHDNSASPLNRDATPSGVYSDVSDLPPPDSEPPPIPSARYTLADNEERPQIPNRRRKQELPALPDEKDTSSSAGNRIMDNPYDTMEFSTNQGAARASNVPAPAAAATRTLGASGTYEEIDKVMKNGSHPPPGPIVTIVPRKKRPVEDDNQVEEYSDTFISIRQSVVGNSDTDEIDLTPQPPTLPHHDYSNVGTPDDQDSGNMVAMKKKPPKPPPFHSTQPVGSNSVAPASVAAATGSSRPTVRSRESPKPPRKSGESPKAPRKSAESPKPPARSKGLPTPPARSTGPSKPSEAEATKPPVRQSYDNPYQLKSKPPVMKKPTAPLGKTRPGSYDDPDEVLQYKEKVKPKKPSREGLDKPPSFEEEGTLYDNPEEGTYDTAEAVYDDAGVNLAEVAASPKFDDGIYMSSGGGIHKEQSGRGVATPPAAAKPPKPVKAPDPLGPLDEQNYFHGFLSRPEAEGLLMADGEYLIRESSKKPGQYVLTGMANGKIQHLLLMDKQGKVKSKDREFESVQHLIQYFIKSQLPLVIGNSQVFLKKPIVNAFLNT